MKKLLPLCLLAVVALAVAAQARTWTQASTGKTIEGDFMGMKDANTAIIKVDGQNKNIPLSMLAKEDQEFIASQAKSEKPAAPGSTAEKKEPAPLPEGSTKVVLDGVHLCCGGCKTAATKAVGAISDVEVDIVGKDKVTIKGPTGEKVQSAVKELAKAGFYGKSDSEAIFIPEYEGKDDEVTSVEVSKIHLCCGSCLKAIDKVVKSIDGATEHTATEDSREFEIKGKFKKSAVLAALHKAGFNAELK